LRHSVTCGPVRNWQVTTHTPLCVPAPARRRVGLVHDLCVTPPVARVPWCPEQDLYGGVSGTRSSLSGPTPARSTVQTSCKRRCVESFGWSRVWVSMTASPGPPLGPRHGRSGVSAVWVDRVAGNARSPSCSGPRMACPLDTTVNPCRTGLVQEPGLPSAQERDRCGR